MDEADGGSAKENVVDWNFWRETHPKPDDEPDGGGGGPPPGDNPPPPPQGVPPVPLSEDALALQLANRLAGDWHYVASWDEWLYWDGRLWARDIGCSLLYKHIRDTCRWSAAGLEAKGLARSITGWRAVSNVERLARSDPRLVRKAEEFDADDFLLNTPGGIVDLRTGQLHPHQKDKLLTQMAGAAPEGDCPKWKLFLEELTDGDPAYQDYLQRLVGYSLTGSTEEEIFAFLYGPANTGKSKFVETVRALHGTYGCSSSMETFIATQQHGHMTEIARFVGKRLVTAAETDEGCRWDQQRMTTLTGRDEITANFMRQDQFSFYPKFLLCFHGNHQPRVLSDGGAMKRRMHLLPCKHHPKKPDKRLIDNLKAELGGIMAWAIKGVSLWKRHGLSPPPIIAGATEEYFNNENIIAAWIDDCCERDPSKTSLSKDLYLSYTSWARAANEYIFSQKRFGQALVNLGFEHWKHPQTRVRGFVGLKLRDQQQQEMKV